MNTERNPQETPRRETGETARVESGAEMGASELKQLIERMNSMTAAEVETILQNLDYQELSVLYSLGELVKIRMTELENRKNFLLKDTKRP